MSSTEIRPEYAELAGEFERIARDFGHPVDAPLRRDVARLAAALEIVDRRLDVIADDHARSALWRDLLGAFADGRPLRDGELAFALHDLRALAIYRGVHARMARVLAKEVATSEALRTTRDPGAFVRGVLREGRLIVTLLFLVVGDARPELRRFFFALAGPANAVDKLLDVRADHARGEMRLAPTAELYARLLLAVARATPALFTLHPRRRGVLALGARYLFRGASA